MRVQSEKTASRRGVVLEGIGVSAGVAVGPVFLLTPAIVRVEERDIAATDVEGEIIRFEEALIETRKQLREIQATLQSTTRSHDASILDAHLMVLDDRTFIEEVVGNVRDGLKNIEFVVDRAAAKYASALGAVRDEYLRERVSDVRDVGRRIVRALCGAPYPRAGLPQEHVLVADNLAPSETATLRKDKVIGFATDLGSPTSHTAVMARALEIPAVVGLHDVTSRVATGDQVLIDGSRGILIVNPTEDQLIEYGKMAEVRRSIERGLSGLQHEPAETKDGHRVLLSANIEEMEELAAVKQYGADGVGLFRTEFLFLSRSRMLSEDEQYDVYRRLADALHPAPVIIRTLDVGGDKFFLPGMQPLREDNPFLGCRSIRLSLKHPTTFKEQLRAVLRASVVGNIKLMYPMISNVHEVEQANAYLDEAKQELATEGVPFDADIEVGVMIEVPSAALVADRLAEHVSFFSIGSNDLIQYTIAVDRGNERVAYLYEPTHPAVLKLIRMTIKAALVRGIWVGLCGEMAADPVLAPLLLGMGLSELSVTPRAVPLVKDAIRSITMSQARTLAKASLVCKSSAEVLAMCRELTREVAPEILELV